MPDREKVIKGLECCAAMSGDECNKCPYGDEFIDADLLYGIPHLASDALAMLKKQEAVFANLAGDWLREIALNNFDCNRNMTFLDAVEDIRDRASYGLKQYFIDKQEGR